MKKQVRLHEVESIDNANMITIAVNPKEYYEEHRSRHWNKKHKGMRKDFRGMTLKHLLVKSCHSTSMKMLTKIRKIDSKTISSKDWSDADD